MQLETIIVNKVQCQTGLKIFHLGKQNFVPNYADHMNPFFDELPKLNYFAEKDLQFYVKLSTNLTKFSKYSQKPLENYTKLLNFGLLLD